LSSGDVEGAIIGVEEDEKFKWEKFGKMPYRAQTHNRRFVSNDFNAWCDGGIEAMARAQRSKNLMY
jgi:hypothetical protein